MKKDQFQINHVMIELIELLKEKYIKLPPVPRPSAISGTICSDIVWGIVPPKALAGSQGVILYFSTELIRFLLEKKMHNQSRFYKFYEWKQISRTSVIFQHEFMECNFGN